LFAAAVRATVQGGVEDARLMYLRENEIPMISSAPGFVAGYWTAALDDVGIGFVLFEDEAAAKASSPPAGTDMGAGVTIESVELREVIGTA
jgi:hypothetical protein